ncbi:MAG: hypothetical protein QXM42_05710 [Zestosphaera sp.]
MVKELLLGDNPFIGVSHLAHEKSRESLKELSIERKIQVLEAALEGGATGFTFSTHPANLELFTYLRDNNFNLLRKFNYYILVPYAVKYVREATKSGTPGLLKKVLLAILSRDAIRLLISPSPSNILKLFIEMELKEYLKILPESNIKAILLHEVLTELIIAFDLNDLIKVLKKHFNKRYFGFGLETRNLPHLKRFLDINNLRIDYIMTPLNPLGYQMTNIIEIEKDVFQLSRNHVKVIAINILASGAVSIHESIEYLRKFDNSIYAIAIGTSKPDRAREVFKLLKSRLINDHI